MTVSQVLKRYGQQYLDTYGKTMTAQQKKVLRAVIACREESLGTIRYGCLNCGHEHTLPRSCCNRHCPACQHELSQAWLAQQQDRLLPCAYFLITFTVPREVRAAFQRFPAEGYAALMSSAAEALKEAATNARHVGATECGFFGVLHTWGRDLSYHPHVHFVVPAGGLDASGSWKSSRVSVFVPTQILAVLFRNKLRDRLRRNKTLRDEPDKVEPNKVEPDEAEPNAPEPNEASAKPESGQCFDAIPSSVWQRRWTVDSKAVGDGKHALTYLAPYVMRGAVANWRLTERFSGSSRHGQSGVSPADSEGSKVSEAEVSLEAAMVSLQVKRSGCSRYRGVELSVIDFIRRWLHHVLPKGLHRVRHYGFMHSSSRHDLAELQWLVAATLGDLYYLTCTQSIVQAPPSRLRCPHCGGAMVLLGYFDPPEPVFQPAPETTAAARLAIESWLSSLAPP